MLQLIGRAQEYAGRTAVVSGGVDYRYDDLLTASHRLASVLLAGWRSAIQLWLLGLVQMASFGLVILIGSWITLLLRNQFGLTPTSAGALGSVVFLLGIVTRPLGGMLVTVIGVRLLLAASLVVNASGCLLLAGARSSLGSAIAAIALLGVGCGLPYAGLFNRAAAMFPGRAGAAMGLVNMLGIVMILVGAPAVGKIADWTGSFGASFVALAAFNAVVLLMVGFIRK